MSESPRLPKPSLLESAKAIFSRYWKFTTRQNLLGKIVLIALPLCGICFLCAIPLSIFSPARTPSTPVAQSKAVPTLSSANKPIETNTASTSANETQPVEPVTTIPTATNPAPTVENAESPTGTAAAFLAGTVITTANVRESPTTKGKLITTLQQGAIVRADGRNEQSDWLKIEQGWIFAELVDLKGDITILPIINLQDASNAPQGALSGLGRRTKTSNCVVANGLPDSACTPGAVIADLTLEKICAPGFTKTVRDVTDAIKADVFAEYGVVQVAPGQYEIDHLIPLELGGSNDIANLWAEIDNPRPGFHEKDQVENLIHDQVCSGAMPLAEAQNQFATNWLGFNLTVTPETKSVIQPTQPAQTQIANQCPQGCTTQSPGCNIKGNINSNGEKIYHMPGDNAYNQTEINPVKGERWFCTSAEAEANGFRHAQQQ